MFLPVEKEHLWNRINVITGSASTKIDRCGPYDAELADECLACFDRVSTPCRAYRKKNHSIPEMVVHLFKFRNFSLAMWAAG